MSQFNNKGVDVDAILDSMRKNRSQADQVLVSDEDMDAIIEGASDKSLEDLIEELEESEDITFNI